MKRTWALIALLLGLFLGGEIALARSRVVSAPRLAEGAFAALGALRSIAAEVIWFRADRLQEEGRYVELVSLAQALTAMEPHTPEVWSYAAWNLAYNVSVMMETSEDRWRWVLAGIRLLRDDGLRFNPGDPELVRELAWLFELKLGADIDSAASDYRRFWKGIVEDIRSRGAWEELAMDERKMGEIEQATGLDDWNDPQLSAIYWAREGAARADDAQKRALVNIIRQAAIIYRKRHP